MTNFESAYNVQPKYFSFSTEQFENTPQISFDLYEPEQSFDYPSPTSSVIIHHHAPIYSPPPPPPSQAVSKLRQINNELCHTLAQCDLNTNSYAPPSPHYHVHHYPISRSPSPSLSSSSSLSASDFKPISPKKSNARITYKARVPRRRRTSLSKLDDLLISTSDAYSQQEPTTVDIYPTRDNGFVKQIRNRPDNQSPWLPDTPVRRYSFSETNTFRTPRTPRTPDYENQFLQPKSRLISNRRERPRSSSAKSRSFSASAPVWRPSGSIKRSKFIGSNAPPAKPKRARHEPVWKPTGTLPQQKAFRAFEPASKSVQVKSQEPVWHPPPKNPVRKPIKHFEPTPKPIVVVPIKKEPLVEKIPKRRISSADPKLKTRINNAQSKVKSAWESGPPLPSRKPPIVQPTVIKPKSKPKPKPKPQIIGTKSAEIDTGRNSLKDGPGDPQLQSTPKDPQSPNSDNVVSAIFGGESPIHQTPPKPIIQQLPTQIEKTPPKPTNRRSPEPPIDINDHDSIQDSEIRSVIDIPPDGDDTIEPAPISPNPHKTPTPEPDNDDDEEEVQEDKEHNPPSPLPDDANEATTQQADANEELANSFFDS